MMKFGIIGAMESEIRLLKSKMDVQNSQVLSGFEFFEGQLSGKDAVLVCCGIGKINSAACTQMLISHFGVTHVINPGVAGSADKRLRVCDIVISSSAACHDVDPALFTRNFPYQWEFPADAALIETAEKACEAEKGESRFYTGRIATGDVFVADRTVKDDIANRMSPLCIEMESAAIGHVCTLNKTPFVAIRCISDNADSQADMSFDEFVEIAADLSARIMMDMLKIM